MDSRISSVSPLTSVRTRALQDRMEPGSRISSMQSTSYPCWPIIRFSMLRFAFGHGPKIRLGWMICFFEWSYARNPCTKLDKETRERGCDFPIRNRRSETGRFEIDDAPSQDMSRPNRARTGRPRSLSIRTAVRGVPASERQLTRRRERSSARRIRLQLRQSLPHAERCRRGTIIARPRVLPRARSSGVRVKGVRSRPRLAPRGALSDPERLRRKGGRS